LGSSSLNTMVAGHFSPRIANDPKARKQV